MGSKGGKNTLAGMAAINNATRKTLLPPVLKEVSKLAAGVAAVSAEDTQSGSATGNPRNKCALQPGHSLMDWIRLGASGKDLTGVGEKAGRMTITPAQLAQHSTPDDAWLAIRGRVYNITHYLPFHPGGIDELMKGAGKDATQLFDEVHPWVNYAQILQKCYIGRLSAFDSSRNELKTLLEEIGTPKESKLAIPRFDWIQKLDELTLIFYTRPYANPAVIILEMTSQSCEIRLDYDGIVYTNQITFKADIDPGLVDCRMAYESGKIELRFGKLTKGVWDVYGTLIQSTSDVGAADRCRYVLTRKTTLTHDSFLLEFEWVNGQMVVPIGKHIRAFRKIDGVELSRSYTPVPANLLNSSKSGLCLAVKRYPDGNLSRQLVDAQLGDTFEFSKPLGNFRLDQLEKVDHFFLLAAGTGITPMLAIIFFLLERRIRRCRKIHLLFFNKTPKDILFKDQLDNLAGNDTRFIYENILSQPDADWIGLKGRVNKQLIETILANHRNESGYNNDLFVLICGPDSFTDLTKNLLKDLNMNVEQIHCFLG